MQALRSSGIVLDATWVVTHSAPVASASSVPQPADETSGCGNRQQPQAPSCVRRKPRVHFCGQRSDRGRWTTDVHQRDTC